MTGPPAPPHDDSGEVPARCPSCGSRDVVTASKIVDASTYWRCGACGEVWNVSRQREASRHGWRHPLNR